MHWKDKSFKHILSFADRAFVLSFVHGAFSKYAKKCCDLLNLRNAELSNMDQHIL